MARDCLMTSEIVATDGAASRYSTIIGLREINYTDLINC
jgi:hypothetical protein